MAEPLTSNEQNTGVSLYVVLAFGLIVAVVFFLAAGVPYLLPGSESIRGFAGREPWILAHIVAGGAAIFIGPFQIWMGLRRKALSVHRKLGYAYLTSIAVSSVSAFYLAATTLNGWMFGLGLAGLGLAWVVTTGLAVIAVRKHDYLQHQEWMIRSYVVTFGFVFFRIFVVGSSILEVGEIRERLTVASWICWSLPLLVTEAAIQGRKIFRV
ncbi:MAG: DUF2306 domain-containing protein [Acidobacteriota bacterium]|nr:MAG: DUF2306 domain-containing protein [Acidobacteriota bacterium]